MGMTLVKLGSIYFDGNPVAPGSALDGQQFSIGDTRPGKELQWDGVCFWNSGCSRQ